ncbi:transcriptional regulator, AraC family [Burkholderia sp. GAS332]|nr:transcriptional regulator, AraC family [Burkholderia sp. GAS332]
MIKQRSNAVSWSATDFAADSGGAADQPVVQVEERWRCPPPCAAGSVAGDRIAIARWAREPGEGLEVSSRRDDRFCIVGISLRPATVRFQHGGNVIWDGPLMPGSIQITAPGESVSASYSTSCRVMHLFIEPDLLSRRYEEADGALREPLGAIANPRIFRDVALERFATALEEVNPVADTSGRLFADSICDAIVARLLTRAADRTPRAARRAAPLPAWRLRRALDFIEANLAQPIGLADVAASTGLTRMHFAAQFRSTTGYSPHAYLLRRRIEHAQMLLRSSTFSVLDVALSCGFGSHAHFTTVFGRMVGESPNSWRTRMLQAK